MGSTTDTVIGLIGDLRAVADWLEENVGTVPDIGGWVHVPTAMVLSFPAQDEADMLEVARWLARGTTPEQPLHKKHNDEMGWLEVERHFGRFYMWGYVPREQACERIVTGTETVYVPDPDVEPILVPVERDVVEWLCHPLLAADRRATREENLAGVAEAKATLGGPEMYVPAAPVDPTAVALVGEELATAYAQGEEWARVVIDTPDDEHTAFHGWAF